MRPKLTTATPHLVRLEAMGAKASATDLGLYVLFSAPTPEDRAWVKHNKSAIFVELLAVNLVRDALCDARARA